MLELKKYNIENIKNCYIDENCSKESSFLDSGSVLIQVRTTEINKSFSYEEIHPINAEENNIEENEIRKHAQKLLTIINNKLNLKEKFSLLFERLPKGWYGFYRGSGNSMIYLRNRK